MTLENLSEQKLLFTYKISFVTADLVLPDFYTILLIDVDQIKVSLKQKSRRAKLWEYYGEYDL